MTPAKLLRHIVLIKVSATATPEAAGELASDLDNLVRGQPHALHACVQRDLGLRPGSPRAATWVATLDFATRGDFEAYLASTEHRRFLTRHGSEMAALLAVQVPVDQPATSSATP